MNTEAMFSSKTDLWETPQDLFDKLNAVYNFETDVCALPENAKCQKYYTPAEDGLKQKWGGCDGATLHTGGISGSGSKKHTRRTR